MSEAFRALQVSRQFFTGIVLDVLDAIMESTASEPRMEAARTRVVATMSYTVAILDFDSHGEFGEYSQEIISRMIVRGLIERYGVVNEARTLRSIRQMMHVRLNYENSRTFKPAHIARTVIEKLAE